VSLSIVMHLQALTDLKGHLMVEVGRASAAGGLPSVSTHFVSEIWLPTADTGDLYIQEINEKYKWKFTPIERVP